MLRPSIYRTNLFDDLFDGFPFFDGSRFNDVAKNLYGQSIEKIMNTDIHESEKGYTLDMELPGYKKDDINLSLENGYLTVQATRNSETTEGNSDSDRFIRKERYTGSCSRSFYVGNQITEDDIKAEFKDGILRLDIPKVDPCKAIPQKKCIAISG